MNIILCGFKNAGKTTVGQQLAERLKYHFDDTDRLIEKYYLDKHDEVLGTNQIYSKHGKDIFRKLEKDIVHQMEHLDNRVIALGGGVVLDSDNVTHLKKIGSIIYLRASKNVLKERLLAARLPAFFDPDEFEKSFEEMYLSRFQIYLDIADVIIDVDGKSVDNIVDEILQNRGLYGK